MVDMACSAFGAVMINISTQSTGTVRSRVYFLGEGELDENALKYEPRLNTYLQVSIFHIPSQIWFAI